MYVKMSQSSLKRHILRKTRKIVALAISYRYTPFCFLERATRLTRPNNNSYGASVYKTFPHTGSLCEKNEPSFPWRLWLLTGAGQEERGSWLFFPSLHTRMFPPPKHQSLSYSSRPSLQPTGFQYPQINRQMFGAFKWVLWNRTLCTVIPLSQKCLHLEPIINISQSLANNLTFHKHQHRLRYSH